MNLRVVEHLCLQPVGTGYRVTAGRRSLLLDLRSAQLIGACVARDRTADEIVRAVAAETGEAPSKLHAAVRSLTLLGAFVSGGGPSQRGGARFRTIPEAELDAGPLPEADAVLRCRRQTLLRPAPGGFYVWSSRLRARVLLGPGSLGLLGAFAGPGQTVAAASAGPHAATVSRLLKAGVLVSVPAGAVAPPPPVAAAAPSPEAPRVPKRLFARDAGSGRIPVYCVNAGQSGYQPLALGLMVAHARAYQGGKLLERYDFVPDWLDSEAAVEASHRLNGSGVFLFSVYVWCARQVLEISRKIKERDRDSLIVFGGPNAPKYEGACEAYFKVHQQVDLLVRGEGETTLAEALDHLGKPLRDSGDGRLAAVRGLTFRSSDGKVVRTPERERAKDLSAFPSPYLSGLFDDMVRGGGAHQSMILETNRGCPYGCTFCDWGSATLQKIMKFPMERVQAELEWAGRNRIPQIWCADANFGIFDRDVEIAEMIVRTREKHGFPTQMTVNYAKNATERQAEILKIFSRGGVHAEGILSIQSTSEQTLKTIRRENIKTKRYDELAEVFRNEGLRFASDLMIGLPGDTVESFKDSLHYFFDRDVWVQTYQTIMLPNSPMADPEYLKEHQIVLAGSVVIGSFSYGPQDWEVMSRLAGYYQLLVNLGVLKYVLRFLQRDRGLRAVDVLHRMVAAFAQGDGATRFPLMGWLLDRYRADLESSNAQRIVGELDAPSSWTELFAEVRDFLTGELGVPSGAALDAALAAQLAVLPDEDGEYPLTVELEHDVVRYLEDGRAARGAGPARALSDYPPGRLVVSDPESLSASVRPPALGRDHISPFELDSPLRARSGGARATAPPGCAA